MIRISRSENNTRNSVLRDYFQSFFFCKDKPELISDGDNIRKKIQICQLAKISAKSDHYQNSKIFMEKPKNDKTQRFRSQL